MLVKILLMKHDLYTIIKKKSKGIYGNASKKDLNELKGRGY